MKKKYSFHDRFWWWLLGFGMLLVSWIVQVCIIATPFTRKKDG